MRIRQLTAPLALFAMAVAGAAFSQQNPAPANAAKDPAKLRARDAHQDLLVAADAWTHPEDYKTSFVKKSPYDAGVVAIDVYFRNDGAVPIQLNLATVRLTISLPKQADQNMPPLQPPVVANYMYSKGPVNPERRRLPIGSGGGNISKDEQKSIDELRTLQFSSDLLPPHGTVHGLMYFDIGGHFDWISYCRLYVPDLKIMGTDKMLFFFDVPLLPPAPDSSGK